MSSRIVLLLALLLANGTAGATMVRGRIDFRGPAGFFPMINARVDLCTPADTCWTYVTGTDGMYYIDLPPGQYIVKVNGVHRYTVVVPQTPTFDIPPIAWN